MERCKHNILRRGQTVHLAAPGVSRLRDGNSIVADVKRCVECDAWLSLGPSNDKGTPREELRAARLTGPRGSKLRAADKRGWRWSQTFGTLPPHADELAGFLLHVICYDDGAQPVSDHDLQQVAGPSTDTITELNVPDPDPVVDVEVGELDGIDQSDPAQPALLEEPDAISYVACGYEAGDS